MYLSTLEVPSPGFLQAHAIQSFVHSTCNSTINTFNVSYEMYKIGSMKFKGVAGIVTENKAELPPTVDGIMGLWYVPQIAQVPILNVLKTYNVLSQNVIGVWLQSVPPSGGANTAPGGEITFGGLNPARYKGEITYIDNIPKQHWTIPVAGMKVGDTVINTNSAPATIDTGTTAMLMPKSVADAINRAIPGAEQGEDNLWYLPCSGNTPISITFGTFTINIPYTSLAIQQAVVETTTGNYCLSAAMFPTGSMAVIDQWLIGDAVLSNVYTVFDFDTNAANGGRIGFAQLNTTDKNSSGDEEANNGSFKGITSSIVLLQATAVVVMSALFAVL
ncbi:hypothetical protein BGX27_007264 [Mortierella sp. AM989]|nr:hypothetical protein BGX27_007264 [Mortierella sp. AM989]